MSDQGRGPTGCLGSNRLSKRAEHEAGCAWEADQLTTMQAVGSLNINGHRSSSDSLFAERSLPPVMCRMHPLAKELRACTFRMEDGHGRTRR